VGFPGNITLIESSLLGRSFSKSRYIYIYIIQIVELFYSVQGNIALEMNGGKRIEMTQFVLALFYRVDNICRVRVYPK